MYQFFVDSSQIDIVNKTVTITGPDVNHIKNVLRMKIGEELAVSNGQDGREFVFVFLRRDSFWQVRD